jgi:hypothetical protein
MLREECGYFLLALARDDTLLHRIIAGFIRGEDIVDAGVDFEGNVLEKFREWRACKLKRTILIDTEHQTFLFISDSQLLLE